MNTGATMLIDSNERMDQLIEVFMSRGDNEEIATEKAAKIVEKEERFES